MTTYISSQSYLDDKIVDLKIKTSDYEVLVSPELNHPEFGVVRVVLDGHHSYHASIEAGVAPSIIEATPQDNDNVLLLLKGDIELFLESVYIDSDYYVLPDAVEA